MSDEGVSEEAIPTAPARGVIYFNYGTKCIERLLVSLHSLRKHYGGPVAVINIGPVEEALVSFLEPLEGVELIIAERIPYRALVNKVHCLQYTPFDLNVFLDADTLVTGPIDEFFDALEGGVRGVMEGDVGVVGGPVGPAFDGPVDFVWCNFCGWKSHGPKVKKRMERWRGKGIVPDKWIDDGIAFGPAINVGTFAFRRGAPWLREWMEMTRRGGAAKLWIPDEQAAQIALPRTRCRVLGPKWGVSVRYGDSVEDKRIIHYHGNKHDKAFPLCNLWREARDEMRMGSFVRPSLADETAAVKDVAFVTAKNQNSQATLVVAVNRPYLELFKHNYQTWTNFRDKFPKLIIYNGIDPKEFEFLTGEYRLVEWKMDGVSPKEMMLTSFVACAPWEVKTPYWIKLDADTAAKPDTQLFSSSVWYDYDLVSHRWTYTKPGKWLCTLEEWADGTMPGKARIFTPEQFARAAVQNRFGHPRIQSFVCLHNTEFTRYAARLLYPDGHVGNALANEVRMPVPSHDTYLWYVAARGGYKVKRVNIRRWKFEHGSKRIPRK